MSAYSIFNNSMFFFHIVQPNLVWSNRNFTTVKYLRINGAFSSLFFTSDSPARHSFHLSVGTL